MSQDTRGFLYALEPVMRRQQWELDATQGRLAVVQREVEEAQAAVAGLREQVAHEEAAGRNAVFDAADLQRRVRWLARLRAQAVRAQAALDALLQQRREVRAEYARQQNKLEVLQRHREETLGEFVRGQQARSAAAADGEWLARGANRGAGPGAPGR